jgi:predicted solute-binding protein
MIPAPRIGCVPYLNARPLLEGIGYPVTEMVPARLGDLFLEGMLDAALLSSVDVLTMSDPAVVDGISISCRGPVQSVLLAYTGELSDLRSVEFDPSSHTSNLLAQIVLGEFYGHELEYVQLTERIKLNPPAVVIGDPALSLSNRLSSHDLKFLDLGEEWVRYTGLPFVFALWTLRTDYSKKSEISELLRRAKRRGLGEINRIADGTADPEFTKSYLGRAIRYDLGEEEKRGLECFRGFIKKMKSDMNNENKITYF